MRLFKYRAGQRRTLDEDELDEVCATFTWKGGQRHELLTRPFGPDASITHTLFDFRQSGFSFTIDLRAHARRGALLFHEINTDKAILGWEAIEEASLLLLSRLHLVAQFSTGNRTSLVADARLAVALPAGCQETLVVTTREGLAKAIVDHYAR